MSKLLKGRIVEIWSEAGQELIELVVGDRRAVLKTADPRILENGNRPIRRGDIVQVEFSPSHEMIRLERLSGPYHADWSPLGDSIRWRRVTSGPSRMALLHQRQEIISAIRNDLYEQGFLEIETPLLVKGTCPDSQIESIAIANASDEYLVTSTEYQIKRMIVGGFEKVFTLTKNFRANDRGKYHSSEFTMLEWARVFETLDEIEEDVVRFTRRAFQLLHPGKTSLTYNGNEIDFLLEPWERLTVRDAFRTYLGMDDLGDFTLAPLAKSAKQAGIVIPANFESDGQLTISYLLDLMQPHLGKKTPTFLREWPAFMTSSARLSSKDPHAAERSELYMSGIEISDGFPFLQDPAVQRSTFRRELHHRQAMKASNIASSVALDERYIDALVEGIPPGAGMALGVDRLVMVLTGASQLGDIQTFTWDEL